MVLFDIEDEVVLKRAEGRTGKLLFFLLFFQQYKAFFKDGFNLTELAAFTEKHPLLCSLLFNPLTP